MISDRKPANLERLRYWQGQRLLSRDLRSQVGIEAEYRWWHNRALHNAYGVIAGWRVTLGGRATGETFLLVGPGLAYDAFGRELILQHPAPVPLPVPPHDDLTLLAAYQESADYPAFSGRPDVPVWQGEPPLETPRLFWMPSDTVRVIDGVPLGEMRARASLTDTMEWVPLRPPARPLARPRIGSGTTTPGAGWNEWYALAQAAKGNKGPEAWGAIEITVDTSAAGFTDLPCYFAWLYMQPPQGRPFPVMIHLEHITQATARSFVFRALLMIVPVQRKPTPRRITARTRKLPSIIPDSLIFATEQRLYVGWLGIQHDHPTAAKARNRG